MHLLLEKRAKANLLQGRLKQAKQDLERALITLNVPHENDENEISFDCRNMKDFNEEQIAFINKVQEDMEKVKQLILDDEAKGRSHSMGEELLKAED